jgi:hypothetical protein
MTTRNKGVVDRIEDGTTAVILLEDDSERRQLEVPVEYLPPGTHEEGTLVTVTVSNGEFVEAEPRSEETASQRQAMKEKFKSLAKRLSNN